MPTRELTKEDSDKAWHLFNVARGKEQIAKAAISPFNTARDEAQAVFDTAESRAKDTYGKAVATAQGKLDTAIDVAKGELSKIDDDAEKARQELADHQAMLIKEVGYEAQLPVAAGGGRTNI